MRIKPVQVEIELPKSRETILLVSPDPPLIRTVQPILSSLGFTVEAAADVEAALAAAASIPALAALLLDSRLGSLANGRLLAALRDPGTRIQCAIALIAEEISDEWIARLREGIIDDIVPRDAGLAAWTTHISTMQRGHLLFREFEALREASTLDVQLDRLTGAFHRETMITLLFRETDRVQRMGSSMCLIAFDIDDFAHWNRELGHAACDALLREVSTRTSRLLRSYDLLGRIAGDEFLLALPGCSTINAVMLAERLRMEVFGEPFVLTSPLPGPAPQQVRLTACFGIAASHGRSPVVVLRETERTLARSRQSGPDNILCSSDSTLSEESALGFAQLFPEASLQF